MGDIELSGAVNGEPSALLHHSEDNGLHLVVGDEGEVHVEPFGLGVDGKATAGADERIDGYGYGRGAALEGHIVHGHQIRLEKPLSGLAELVDQGWAAHRAPLSRRQYCQD